MLEQFSRPLCCRGYFIKQEIINYDKLGFDERHLYFLEEYPTGRDFDPLLVCLGSLLNAGGGVLLVGITQLRLVNGIRIYTHEIEENIKTIRALFQRFQPQLGDTDNYKMSYVPVRNDHHY